MKIEYKAMRMYLVHRNFESDHEFGRPAIFLQFFGLESLVWLGTTKCDAKAVDKPVAILLNNQLTYFYNKGLSKIATNAIKNIWKDNKTQKIITLTNQEQEYMIAKFSTITLVQNPYEKITDLEKLTTQQATIIKKASKVITLFGEQNKRINELELKVTLLEKRLKLKEHQEHGQ